jgi:aryl-alcohol dehydrogenase-like predicted oxidoreductase
MQQRHIGKNGPLVGEIGLGTMGMSEFYGDADEAESIRTIHRALELGVTLLDTADIYGPYKNEELVGRAIAGKREGVFLCTKFGIVRDPANPMARGVNGKPDYVRASLDASLKRLNVDYVDLYYQHRIDKDTPIEETAGALAELVAAGKVRHIGLSEASAATIRRAGKVHPIAAVQSEYSLFSRDIEDTGVTSALRELGITLVAYSPLGRGFLSGKIRSLEQLEPGDFRRHSPRFQGENFAKNLGLVDRVGEIASELGVTPAQVALAWVLAKGDDIVPIPGTTRVARLEENVAATAVTLSAEQMQRIEAAAPKGGASGDRYPDMSVVNV